MLVYFIEECNKLRLYIIIHVSCQLELGPFVFCHLKKAYIASSVSDLLVNKQWETYQTLPILRYGEERLIFTSTMLLLTDIATLTHQLRHVSRFDKFEAFSLVLELLSKIIKFQTRILVVTRDFIG